MLPGHGYAVSARSASGRIDSIGWPPVFVREAIEEVADQRRQIVDALAERREMDPDDGEPLVEVGAEAPRRHERLEVAVGRGDDAEVHFVPVVLAEPADDAILEDAQQLHLGFERRVVDLVEEDRAAGGGHQLTVVRLHGAENAPRA